MTDLEIIKEKLDELGATQQLMLEVLQAIGNTLNNMNAQTETQLEINKKVLEMMRPKL